MIISKINHIIGFKQNFKPASNYSIYNNSKPLACDTVSFGSIKEDIFDNTASEQEFVKQVFDTLNIDYEVCDDGLLIIDEYRQPSDNTTFSDVGLDENTLFKYIKKIKGNANFKRSKVTNLGNLEQINGIADFKDSEIKDLGKLKKIKRDGYFKRSKIKSLGSLESIRGSACFGNSEIVSLGNLQNIGGNADFSGSKVEDINNLQRIGRNAFFKNSLISDLKNLKYIGKDAHIENSNLKKEDLKDVEIIGQIKD